MYRSCFILLGTNESNCSMSLSNNCSFASIRLDARCGVSGRSSVYIFVLLNIHIKIELPTTDNYRKRVNVNMENGMVWYLHIFPFVNMWFESHVSFFLPSVASCYHFHESYFFRSSIYVHSFVRSFSWILILHQKPR